MIHDKIENLIKYIPIEYQKPVSAFLLHVNTADDGTYEICGKDIFAKVMTYPTKKINECIIEAHNIYCDIQFSIQGMEGISVFPRQMLKAQTSEKEKDFYTYSGDNTNRAAWVNNNEGYFTLLHIDEAHRPQESVDDQCSEVKKAVIKIREELFHEV